METRHFPPKKILVAFDFSPAAKKAWEFADGISGALGASVEVLFVYEAPIYADPISPFATLIADPMTDDLRKKLIDDVHAEIGKEATVSVLQGFPRDAILKLSRERDVDLIVMGTHGRSGMSRVLFGSVAESLSRQSAIPVVTLRSDWRPIHSILVPMNFTSYSLGAFFAAAALAERLEARFDALFVAAEPYSETLLKTGFDLAAKQLPPYFERKPPRLLRGSGNPAERIVTVGSDYDLIALVAHRKSIFEDIALGTTAERVLRHSRVPVLAVPDNTREAAQPLKERPAAARRRP